MSREDLYVILQIGHSATVEDIKRAYRKLARRYHPDINPGDHTAEEYFKRISEAYEILSDPAKKQFYDQHGFYTETAVEMNTATGGSWGFSFQGFDFSRSSSSGEILSDFLSTGTREGPATGENLEYQISLSFPESIRGLETRITLHRKHVCGGCNGRGRSAAARDALCGSCQGAGTVGRTRGRLRFSMPCPTCGGTGRDQAPCSECSGDGRVTRTESMDISIPAGVSTGSRIRFPGKGDAGRMGAAAGDLYIITNVAPHPFFNRAGDNIQCAVPITLWEAALGAKIEVPTMDGAAIMRIPPGTQHGQVFRLRDRGAPSLLKPGSRGDQFVEVKVVIPRIADERSKEILRELARLNPEDPRKDLQTAGHGSR
jgi:molecular chaperone DnaJ